MIKRILLFFFILFLSGRITLFGQISANPTSGCAPLVGVAFTGLAGASNILWNFGDGTTSSLSNPVHTFATPQTYVVTYTATVSGGPTTQTLSVKVFGKPTPNFTAVPPLSGCIPLPVTFHDNSTGGGGTSITQWQWAFGDGGVNTTNSANQTYTYSVGGQFSVSIKVTDSNGCDSTLTIPNLINVSPKPTIVVSTNPSPPAACNPPLNVTFSSNGTTSHSSTSPTLTYSWSFGNGNNSTTANPPQQTYTTAGTYTAWFSVTDNNGCKDSTKKIITIQNPHASFTTNDTVCMVTAYTNVSTGASTYLWNYGDGNTGSAATHTYTAPGTYTVTLTAYNGSCNDDTSIVVVVEKPVANFTVTPTYMCSLPQTITVTNLSTPMGGSTFSWNFIESYPGDSVTPATSNLVNPTFTITNIDTNRYTVTQMDFQDSITVTMTTARGCKAHANILFVDTIYLPTARYMPDKWQGCVPLTVHFYDSSHSREPIVYYEYDFGDGSPIVTGNANPTHTYTNTGVFWPRLIIHNANGCIDTSYKLKIEVGRPPGPSFSVTPTNICIGDTVHLTNTTAATDSVDTWHFYGDGGYYASSCFTDPNPDWPFSHATGPQTISMVACFRGCCDSVSQAGAVTVKGPLAHFSAAMDCDSSHVYTFTGNISDATNWDWDFGDGNNALASTVSTISHSYTATGDYWVHLTAYNPGTGCGPSKDSLYIHVRDIKADFVYDTVMCTGIGHAFDGSISVDEYTFAHNGYTWIWDDNTHPDITANTQTTHSFSPGLHTVKLIVRDVNNCPDTITKRIKAYAVAAAFTPSQLTICTVDTITFNNTSTADTTIIGYSWNFGDGSFSTQTSPTHTFNISNPAITTDTVKLTVTTTLGCTNTFAMVLNISRPSAIFTNASSVNICSGDSVRFNHPVVYPTMNWTFGDGGTLSGGTAPWHPYNSAGTFTVNLFVKDALGCTDSKSSIVVNVQSKPQVYISSPAFQSTTLCYPYQATFTDSSVVNIFSHRKWDLGTGQIVNNALATVGTIYSAPGTYTVSLAEWTTNGCVDSIKKTFTLYGPVADFALSPPLICKGEAITFNIKDTTDVFTWHWDFGDGLDTTAVSPISHQYNTHPPGGMTNVTLVYWSHDSTCVQTKIYPVSIHQVISDFKRNNEITASDTAHCLGLIDVFTNISTSATNYGWSFGDGATSTALSPSHQYMAQGTYDVELHIKDSVTGCVDTLIKKMYIYPPANGMATGDSICRGSSGQLTASGGVTYSWTPAAGLSCTNCQNPTSSATASQTYSVIVFDVNGCMDTVSVDFYVQQPPPTITSFTSIVIGQTTPLPGDAGIGFTYTWSPTTDLSCTTCPVPTSSSTVDIVYTETIADVMGCFTGQSTFTVEVRPLSSVDVPSAFTPNGDGVNDVVYVAGWGIKKLIYFKIFNRWGELVFETDDLSVGWDGTYKGVPQNTETYVYEAAVLPYIDNKPVTKKGAIKLLR